MLIPVRWFKITSHDLAMSTANQYIYLDFYGGKKKGLF